MRKNYSIKRWLLSSVLGAACLSLSSQTAASYIFNPYQGTYVAITGGSVINTTIPDSYTSPSITLTTPFMFAGVSYSHAFMNSNGFVTLGGAAPATAQYNIIANTTGSGVGFAVINADLRNSLMGSAAGEMRYEYINNEHVFQWRDASRWAQDAVERFSYQVRLNTVNGIIRYVYDMNTTGPATNYQPIVGIRATATDYKILSVTPAGPETWDAPLLGTGNTNNLHFTAAAPTPKTFNSGQVYEWIPPIPCNGAVPSNAVVGTLSLVCPNGSTSLKLANSYTNVGYTYNWVASTVSPVGPFTSALTGTVPNYAATNLTTTTYYQAVITCTVSQQSFTTAVFTASIAGSTTNSVPYVENFEGLVINNQLPNCSWKASNLPTINQTYTIANTFNRIPLSGNKFASFRRGTHINGDYFYTNGIQLTAGITYSASVAYITDGLLGWSEFSMLYGSTQSTVGLTTIASVTGAVTGTNYKWLTNTFTVATSGLYHIAIKAKGNNSPEYLSFDDLSITMPCSVNSPTVSLNPTKTTLCEGEDFQITASGADTYSWSTGQTDTTITTIAGVGGTNIYYVIGTHALSGCSSTASMSIFINPTPKISVFANFPEVCSGQPVNISAFGADNYIWSTSSQAQFITVNPTSNSTYSVTGSNIFGCTKTAVQNISVLPLPTINILSDANAVICAGEDLNLTAVGAVSYQWTWNTNVSQSSSLLIKPMSTTSFILVGTDAKGCSSTTSFTQNVNPCQSLENHSAKLSGIQVFPNPTTGQINVNANAHTIVSVEVIDISGRILLSFVPSSNFISLNLNEYPHGVYYVKIKTDHKQENFKVLKN